MSSSTARVNALRMRMRENKMRTIELKLNLNEISILDAIASYQGISRVLFVSLLVKEYIHNSPYFVSGDKIYKQ